MKNVRGLLISSLVLAVGVFIAVYSLKNDAAVSLSQSGAAESLTSNSPELMSKPEAPGRTRRQSSSDSRDAVREPSLSELKRTASAKDRPRSSRPDTIVNPVRNFPVEETAMAPADPNYQEPVAEPFNKAAAALQSALSALDKSLVFNSFDGVYALAVCGDTYIVASNDGSSVIIRKSGEEQVFETASGTTCSFIGQKDDYYLAQIGKGGYVLTTPTGKEFTLSGAQNAEDASKPFTSSPAAADTISTIAYLQDELPRDHKLYTTPDKTLAVVSTGSRYIVVRNDGSSRVLTSVAAEGYRMQAESGTACALVAGSSDVAIGAPTEEALLIKAEDGSEVVVSQTAYGNEYTAVPSVYRDLNAIPPDLPSDPLFTPARLESADAILTMNEWELSLAEQRILRRLLADLAGGDPSVNSL